MTMCTETYAVSGENSMSECDEPSRKQMRAIEKNNSFHRDFCPKGGDTGPGIREMRKMGLHQVRSPVKRWSGIPAAVELPGEGNPVFHGHEEVHIRPFGQLVARPGSVSKYANEISSENCDGPSYRVIRGIGRISSGRSELSGTVLVERKASLSCGSSQQSMDLRRGPEEKAAGGCFRCILGILGDDITHGAIMIPYVTGKAQASVAFAFLPFWSKFLSAALIRSCLSNTIYVTIAFFFLIW
jgi:hypothetical protein